MIESQQKNCGEINPKTTIRAIEIAIKVGTTEIITREAIIEMVIRAIGAAIITEEVTEEALEAEVEADSITITTGTIMAEVTTITGEDTTTIIEVTITTTETMATATITITKKRTTITLVMEAILASSKPPTNPTKTWTIDLHSIIVYSFISFRSLAQHSLF